MQKAKYTAEFKEEAVRQVIDRGHSVVDVAKRLGIGDGLLYTWVKKFKAANKVGDDVRSFWISPHDVALENFSLEIFAGGWVKLISNGSVSDADLETLTLVYSLMESSKSTCFKLGFPAHHLQSHKISETEAFLIMLKKLLGETVSI